MFRYILASVVLIILVSVLVQRSHLSPNSNQQTQTENKHLKIVTSFYPLYYFTKEIVGNNADIVIITPPTREPHDYELTQHDRIQIENSDLLIVNGVIEKWLPAVQNDTKHPTIVITGQNLFSLNSSDNSAEADPHIWLSPKRARYQILRIRESLEQFDPARKQIYRVRSANLLHQMEQLDSRYTQDLSTCTKDTIVTTHSAFGYLAHDYHFQVIPISGISPEEEPSLQKLAEVSQIVKEKQIHYLFFEQLKTQKYIQTIQLETGATPLVLNPLEGLTQNDEEKGKNYLSIMNDNLYQLKKALECRP